MFSDKRRSSGIGLGSPPFQLLYVGYNLSSTISRKFAYAIDLVLLHSSGNRKGLEGTLRQDMITLSAYLQTWKLKLSHTKMVTAVFYLNKQETKRELKVYNNIRLLPFIPTTFILGLNWTDCISSVTI